jgi:hypothetical protein
MALALGLQLTMVLTPLTHAATFVVTNTLNAGPGSLRQAMTDANTTDEPDVITFNIPPGGLQTILLTFDLPVVISPLVIDGWSQPGFTDRPIIELQGVGAINGLGFVSQSNVVRGLIVNKLPGVAISLESGSSSNTLVGNWLGLDSTGKLNHGNAYGIMILGGTNNVIGGTNSQLRNVISGNSERGIAINSSRNVVLGNYIGTDVDGTNGLGNGYTPNGVGNFGAGIWIEGTAAHNNTIGGKASGAGNLISGNVRGVAMFYAAGTNLIQGNTIGPAAGGMSRLAGLKKQLSGIYVDQSHANLIGGTNAAARNIVSANGDPAEGIEGHGIYLRSGFGNTVQGNYIGTDPTGTAPLGNVRSGIECEFAGNGNGSLIGGTIAGARNVISGNGGTGLGFWQSSSNTVQANYIGVGADGTTALGNANAGIFIFTGSGNTIGGSTAASGNVIAWNGYSNAVHGVFISESGGTSRGNLIRRNSFFSNARLGISLFNINCFTCDPFNDPGDADSGPNTLLNFPVVTNALTSAGTISISGSYNSTANTAVTLEFFANPENDQSGFGEGKTYIGSTTVVTDGSGNAGFDSFFVDAGYAGQFITATATDGLRNTSEFSAATPVNASGGVLQFGAPEYLFIEAGGSVQIDVVRLGSSSGIVSVNYATVSDTATAGADYTTTSGTLTLSNGVTSGSFIIPILNDTTNELSETVLLTLDTPTGGAVLGSRSNVFLTILDDDPINVYVADAAVTKPAAGTIPISFPIYLSSPSARTVSVSYATANLSAEAGLDYLSATGRLDFLPGVVTQFVTATVLSDGLQEGAKTFLLNLSSPSQALLGDSSGVGTIYDGAQGILQFSAASYSGAESASAVTITVTRTGGALGTVSVPFSAVAGTAIANDDFTPTNGVLTFNNGVTSRTFSVPLLNDGASESSETVELLLGTPSGTTLGAPASAVLTITDDDAPPMLSIRAVTGGVQLAWPTQAAGFQLVSSPFLPATNWMVISNAPAVLGTNFAVTNSIEVPARFYQLRQ